MPAGPPIVGDFVVLEPARGEEPVGGEKLSLITLLRLLDGSPLLHPATERSTRLDGEAVERDVIRPEVEQPAHVSLEVATECPGSAKIRSSERFSMPASRAVATARPMAPASWVRCIQASTFSSKLCDPSESRLMPAARHARALSGVRSSGLASTVICAPAAAGKCRSTRASALARPSPPSREGVPPPK